MSDFIFVYNATYASQLLQYFIYMYIFSIRLGIMFASLLIIIIIIIIIILKTLP